MNKPANILVEDTKEELIKVINESGLPPFLVEPIIKDIYNQVVFLKQQEFEKSKKEYEESSKKSSKKEAQNEKDTV